ncbi:hypothetical protein M8818_007671 [Zalaria obscura]|uniref:Uncharacterized protein n=1 Tax=Zalaria obscura TaxID=2024903 RepID=A0ACC3S376_9PEZI
MAHVPEPENSVNGHTPPHLRGIAKLVCILWACGVKNIRDDRHGEAGEIGSKPAEMPILCDIFTVRKPIASTNERPENDVWIACNNWISISRSADAA